MGITFREELQSIINKYSKENGSNTPDFILADFLVNCLAAYDKAHYAREKWYGNQHRIDIDPHATIPTRP